MKTTPEQFKRFEAATAILADASKDGRTVALAALSGWVESSLRHGLHTEDVINAFEVAAWEAKRMGK